MLGNKEINKYKPRIVKLNYNSKESVAIPADAIAIKVKYIPADAQYHIMWLEPIGEYTKR